MSKSFDLIAIGSGSGASGVAMKCRKAGWSVALIDSQPLGGTCAVRGCDPKKVLVGAAEALDRIARLEGKGIRATEAKIDWRELMRFKRSFTEPVPASREEGFTRAGIEVFHGRAHFVSSSAMEVNGETLDARHVHIGAGAKPMELGFAGSELLTTSTAFLELDELPRRLLFVGGGYISFEFAHIAARAGANVTLVHRSRPLKGFDPDLVDQLVERTRGLGIEVHLDTEVTGIEKGSGGLTVRASHGGKDIAFETDAAVHGAGRVPDIDDMELDRAGVDRSAGGVVVNEYLQSVSNPAVYAAGDAAATEGASLTPVAAFEAHIAAANLLEGNHRSAEYPPIPSVAFTLPPLARVGMLEREATDRGLKFRTNFSETSQWYSSRRLGEESSGYKVLIEEETDRILGAHLLGPDVEEVINLFAMAMHTGLKPRDIKKMIFSYPTVASNMPYMV
ncbi:MAG: NAD(P)/FAD-dependent oxidoreductase [Acidobacteriota bacterium]|nr:MAG: NAD(P)/FAD-dependent oxidoreductase [Acidobacteriota bacterium]